MKLVTFPFTGVTWGHEPRLAQTRVESGVARNAQLHPSSIALWAGSHAVASATTFRREGWPRL